MWCYWLILAFFWSTKADKVTLVNGNRKLDLQFNDVAFMDSLSRAAMRKMHDDLDTDEDGNVSVTEGEVFLKSQKDLLDSSEKNANLAGFATDVDGRITEQEFWNSWIQSDAHNWTNIQILTWLKYDVELPQYTSIFHTLNISGAAFPVLACNGSIVTALVEGSKEHKLKLMLKAKEVVLFGPPREKTNFLKDALLTVSLLLALSGIFFGVHVQRNATRTIENIQEKMRALQSSMEIMKEAETEIEKFRLDDIPSQDDEQSRGSNSGESEDSMATISLVDDAMAASRLAEVMKELDVTREVLRNTEKQLERKSLPGKLLELLQKTYNVETTLFKMKKDKVYKDLERTKTQFQKIERHRSTFLGMFQVVHSRQIDSFDFDIQQTRDEFRELQTIMKERMKRWEKIEQLCKCRIKPPSSRNNAPDMLKLTPEGEMLISGLESVSVYSSGSGAPNVSQAHSLSHRQKTRSVKGTSSATILDDENRDSISLHSFNQRKSPSSGKKHGTLPTHVSAPALSSNSDAGDPAKVPSSDKTLPHSESAGQLPSHLLITDTGGNQTFPKRSPWNKRRSKIPSALVGEGSSALASLGTPPVEDINHNATKSDSAENISPGLTITKRSTSVQSLPLVQQKSEFRESSTLDEKSLENMNGTVQTNASRPSNNSSSPVEKERKSNLIKRVFRAKISKKEKT